MSTPIIISIIILIILVSIVLVFIGQAREKAKIEKIRKVNSLQDRYRRLKRLAEELPAQYLAKEIKILVLERSIDSLRELSALQGDSFKYEESLQADLELLNTLKEAEYKPKSAPITDEAQAKEVQSLLEILQKFIEAQKKKGFIEASSAKKHIQLIAYYTAKSKADFYANKAKANISKDKLRLAIHNYHNAITELEAVKTLTVAQKTIKAYRIKIKELDKLADDKKAVKEDKPESIDDEWKSFVGDDEDPWKKKNAYDD